MRAYVRFHAGEARLVCRRERLHLRLAAFGISLARVSRCITTLCQAATRRCRTRQRGEQGHRQPCQWPVRRRRYRNRHTRTRQRSVLSPVAAATGYGQYGYRTWNGCPPDWTIQGGVCKPYQGTVGGEWRTWNGCPPNNTIQGGVCQPYRGNCPPGWTIQQGFCSSYGGVQDLGSGVASLRQARLLLKLQDQL
jgi:hypothetical protein